MALHRTLLRSQPPTSWPRPWVAAFLFGLTLLTIAAPLAAQSSPSLLAPLAPLNSAGVSTNAAQQRGGPHVNPMDRDAAYNFYKSNYVWPAGLALEWSGSQASCTPGATSQRFREAVLKRINYFRAMAGVPADITFSDEYNRKAQAAALMMSANRQLSHRPGHDWRCFSEEGVDAAQNSNLYLETLSPDAIDGYMQDPGDNNLVVPHRRWLLFPQTQQMGSGDVPAVGDLPAANALWVVDGAHYFDPRPATRDGFVAWPPPGFVPAELIFARWSISYDHADFSHAQVAMTLNGQPVDVTFASEAFGAGEATITWQPNLSVMASSFAPAGGDNSFQVNVSNVRIDGALRNFDYAITTFQYTPVDASTLIYHVFAPLVTR